MDTDEKQSCLTKMLTCKSMVRTTVYLDQEMAKRIATSILGWRTRV
jgi:hypothetical protein